MTINIGFNVSKIEQITVMPIRSDNYYGESTFSIYGTNNVSFFRIHASNGAYIENYNVMIHVVGRV